MRAPAIALIVVWALATTVGPTADVRINDLPLYRAYAELLSDGLLPYRDFAFEYPPLALAPMWAGGLAGPGETAYAWCFGALMLAAMLVVQREAALLAGDRGRAVAWMLVALPVAAGAMVRTHFDLVAVALLLAGLRLIEHGAEWAGRDGRGHGDGGGAKGSSPAAAIAAGFALLALGTATKLFPAVAAAAAAVWLHAGGRQREALRGLAAFAAVLALVCAPFAALSPAGFADLAAFHIERPVQIESAPATVLFAAGESYVTGAPVRPDPYKSNGLAGGPADAVALAFTLAQLAAIAAALLVARRSLLLGVFAAVLAFTALNKVLSPQFMLWLAPLAALAWAAGARAPAAAVAAAVVLTQLEFPARYFDLVAADPATIALVGARNALLLAATALVLARGAAPARWRRPAPAPSSG